MDQNGEKLKMNQTAGDYLVHLIACALHDRVPEQKPECVRWEQVYDLAKRNSVEGISWFGVERLAEWMQKKPKLQKEPEPESEPESETKRQAEMLPEKGLYRRWESDRNLTIYRQVCFDEEREAVLEEMKAAGLSYLPLKGIHLAGYYPKPGMRSMADNDILYGFVEEAPDGGYRIRGGNEAEREQTVREAQKVMVEIMKRRGYEVKSLVGNHDSYLKKPVYNFEMHRKLMHPSSSCYAYYENPWKRAIRDNADPYLYSFATEDEYIYFLAHMYKHYDSSGCGIRGAVDQYVFLEKWEAEMDMAYVRDQLRETGLLGFEEKLGRLSRRAFGVEACGADPALKEGNQEFLYYMLGCGTYGNMQIRVNRQIERLKESGNGNPRRVKFRYLWSRLFPSPEVCREQFPFFYRHRYLMPLLLLRRAGRGLIRRPRELWRELKLVLRKK